MPLLKKRYNWTILNQLLEIHAGKKREIDSRLREFRLCGRRCTDEELFGELVFCLLTPQSRAKCCWNAVLSIKEQNLLTDGTVDQIRDRLHRVRFHNKKAGYVVEARSLCMKDGRFSIRRIIQSHADCRALREWLAENIRGLGYKEASHFLRNIGLGENIAILDRHILKNLLLLGVIKEIPGSLSRGAYLLTEQRMAEFALSTGIPLAHLDLLLWYKETGEIFK
ncbi:MAG: N-glycosylase/DNA lyase [Nitrospirota bacterium]